MKKIQTFFYVLKNSVTSSKYYNDILKTDFWFSAKYFLMLSFILSLFVTTVISIRVIPGMKGYVRDFYEKVSSIYPNDLVIDFKDGSWSVNREEPFFINMPEFSIKGIEKIPENLMVFDKNGTIDKLYEYDTLILVNNENFVYMDENGTVGSTPVNTVPNVTIDRYLLESRLNELNKFISVLPYIIPVIMLLFIFGFNFIIPGAFNILLTGLSVFIISMIMRKKMGFVSACKVGIHSMTVPLVIQTVLFLFPNPILYIPGWFLATSIVIGIFFTSKIEVPLIVEKKETEN